ncbi:MAG: dihydrofolate reductase family protein [Candidatus Competibacter sp.]|jgi:dihydrofolate reductase
MNPVKLFIATSLDSYIARTDGRIDWLFTDDDYGYQPFYESVSAVIMGRKTYEQVLTFGDYPYPEKPALVFSRSKAGQADSRVRFVDGPAAARVTDLTNGLAGAIWLVGGAEIVREFMAAQLIDELILSIHPVILGGGIPLFLPSNATQSFALVSCQTFASGLVQLHYRIGQPEHAELSFHETPLHGVAQSRR